jgi:acyl-CoA synthetase (AMP-forming)/AMP-acid ligase II
VTPKQDGYRRRPATSEQARPPSAPRRAARAARLTARTGRRDDRQRDPQRGRSRATPSADRGDDRGLRKGDTLGLMMLNRPEFHVVDAAAMLLGATPFSLYNTSPAEQSRS